MNTNYTLRAKTASGVRVAQFWYVYALPMQEYAGYVTRSTNGWDAVPIRNGDRRLGTYPTRAEAADKVAEFYRTTARPVHAD